MALYLVQHGLSLSKHVDPEKGLSPEGTSAVNRIAEIAQKYQVRVNQIRHSGKKRAQQTADIFADMLAPPKGVQQISGINPLDDVSVIAGTISSDDNVMLVGHLPFMERMTSFLITGSIENPVFKFQNSGIVCLDQDTETKSWCIKWTLMPTIG